MCSMLVAGVVAACVQWYSVMWRGAFRSLRPTVAKYYTCTVLYINQRVTTAE